MSLHEIPTLQFTPDSNIHLLSGVPLTKDYQHTRKFDSSTQQADYFLSKKKRSITAGTYLRKNGTIRFDMNAELLFDINYVMFQNNNYSSKWFYAFVTDVEYSSPNTTFIHFEIDVMQTWQFNYEIKQSYVEREHTALTGTSNLPLVNTIDEGLDYGNSYDTVKRQKIEQIPDTIFAIITTKVDLSVAKEDDKYYSGSQLGMPSTLNYYVIPVPLSQFDSGQLSRVNINGAPITSLPDIYNHLARKPDLQDIVVSINFTPFIPLTFVKTDNGTGVANYDCTEILHVNNNGLILAKPIPFVKSIVHDYFVNANKYEGLPAYFETKLLMYPYSFIELTDEKGEKLEIPLEEIQSDNPQELKVRVKSAISHLPKYAVWVNGLNSLLGDVVAPDMDKALISKDVQDVPIISDYTATYLQGNRNSYNQGLINTGIGLASNVGSAVAMSNPYMAVAGATSAVTSILSTQAKMKDINNRPPSMGNMGKNASFDISNRVNGLYMTTKTIKPEYARKLESYFKLFGYKINEVKYPNLHNRQNWNYVKTNGVMVTGSVIQKDLDKIRVILDKGITFWHTNDVGNYSLTNYPI